MTYDPILGYDPAGKPASWIAMKERQLAVASPDSVYFGPAGAGPMRVPIAPEPEYIAAIMGVPAPVVTPVIGGAVPMTYATGYDSMAATLPDIGAAAPTYAAPVAIETGLPPIVAGVGVMALGIIKALIARYGALFVKTLIGAAAFKFVLDLIRGGASDDTPITIKPRRKARRMSIGTNPRLNTLLKVGKRVDNIFARYDKRIGKFRSRLRGYAPRRRRAYYPSAYLSPVERRQLARGRG